MRERQKEAINTGFRVQGPRGLPLLPTSRVPKASTNLSSSIATRLDSERERGGCVCVRECGKESVCV